MAKARTGAGPAERDASERRRVDFLDIASHELRTPLTVLRGQAQLMQRRLRKQPEREAESAEVAKMLYQIERMANQLDVFLATAHIAQKRFQVNPTEIDLVAAVRRALEAPLAGATGHTIRFEAEPEQIIGEFDRKRIEELIGILLSNALKFSRGGEVALLLGRKDEHTARIEVCDTGGGVPASERRRIFDAYTTGSNAENAGAGLGLYVAREIVRRHHGKIGVRARRDGSGSVFWVELPLRQPVKAVATTAAPPAATHA
jgi:signal transduction histidine kinase